MPKAISPRNRAKIMMKLKHGHNPSAVAEIMGIGKTTAYRLARGLKAASKTEKKKTRPPALEVMDMQAASGKLFMVMGSAADLATFARSY